MDVIAHGDTSTVYGGRFCGPVELEMLRLAPDGSIPDVAVVRFAAGSVSTWHTHPGGQLLYVLEGRARVGTEADGTVELGAGTLVVVASRRAALARRGGHRGRRRALARLGHDRLGGRSPGVAA